MLAKRTADRNERKTDSKSETDFEKLLQKILSCTEAVEINLADRKIKVWYRSVPELLGDMSLQLS